MFETWVQNTPIFFFFFFNNAFSHSEKSSSIRLVEKLKRYLLEPIILLLCAATSPLSRLAWQKDSVTQGKDNTLEIVSHFECVSSA